MLKLNHELVEYRQGETLLQLLEREHYDVTFVAVEIDGTLIRRHDFANVVVHDNAKVEVFSIMGGG